ncbi:ketohydroxyglutarate aldolase [Arthrobacter sp. RT-1]|jgi:hypothetical protein|uniref:ketohydroxyglutarate aldolase n=1 Tax=Arthrobacter sp. RT-1 TaxID=2292263 RepID=UPI000E1E7D9A|nr:ketohydroxyglutarate aldolase [Arthrobacter sp. RT-1]RDV10460.1 ketohydroxyglutarate aldolase [Arthrobacter sp. RT-1]
MVNINVTVDSEHLSAIGEVAEALRLRGMEVEQVLESGFITGSVPNDSRPELETVDGVESVSEDLSYQLPPPDDDIQ